MLLLHRETYIERNPGESINNRNDRAIRVATKWYNAHLDLDDNKIKTVLLTDDARNRELAEKEEIPAISSKIICLVALHFFTKITIFIFIILLSLFSGRLYFITRKFSLFG